MNTNSAREKGMERETNGKPVGAVLVVGGGIAGIQASLDLADSGYKVYLVESGPAIGGTMAQLDKTFPTNDCSMCILSPKLVEAGRHFNIELLTYSDVEAIEGQAGKFAVRVKRKPRYVNPDTCTGCGLCAKVDVPDLSELVEHDGELWADRIAIDEVKCVQCGDCVRACVQENPERPAMSSVHHQQSDPQLPLADPTLAASAAQLRQVRSMSHEQRLAYWQDQMSKCIKCYGCRDICPVFQESVCHLEDWATPGLLPPDAPLYHLARAYYIADSCTHCGYCEDTCPGGLPLRMLVDLVRHEDPDGLFEFVPGLTEEEWERIRTAFPARQRQEERV